MLVKCLFPAAGFGTRFLPATKAMPKEMMPIVNKPLIEYGVEEAIAAGFKNICMVTGRGKRALEDHFDINFELEHQIDGTNRENLLYGTRKIIASSTFSYTRQINMNGLGGAILAGENLIGDQPFGVVLADDLCIGEGDPVLTQMVALYNQFRCSIIAVEEVAENETHKYGIVSGETMRSDVIRVDNMVEKPNQGETLGRLAIIGRYILTPDIFEVLRKTPLGKNNELHITDALLEQSRRGCVLAYKFKGQRFDCGSVDGFIKATNFCYENFHKKNSLSSKKQTEKALETAL